VTTQVTTCDAPAITRSMLDLCSARSSPIGNYVIAGGVMTRI
jgi:hypothetical protein